MKEGDQKFPLISSGSDWVEIITSESRLGEVIALALKQPRVAIDLESNGFYRYPEKICLIQVSFGGSIYLVDAPAIDEMDPLGKLLEDVRIEKIFHSADYDIRSLDRDWGFRVRNLFDTSIASAFLGSQKLGLDAILKQHMSVIISKDKKLQRADWSNRPISCELLNYAASDVRHLSELRDILHNKLDELGRIDWVHEECERLSRVNYTPPDVEWKYLSVKGSSGLNGRELAVLRSLYNFREKEAIRRDRPPFKIFSDSVILELATEHLSRPVNPKGLGPYGNGIPYLNLTKALKRGIRSVVVERPNFQSKNVHRVPLPRREGNNNRLQVLKEWRIKQANRLGVDASLLWPMPSLERLSRNPQKLTAEFSSKEVRVWQNRAFGASLTQLLKTL